MSLSPVQLATHLPRIRELIEEWKSKNTKGTSTPKDTDPSIVPSDVILAFRTRPILPGEGEMLVEQVRDQENAIKPEDLICSGITVQSGEPGIMVAHLPAMKVCRDSIPRFHRFIKLLAFLVEGSRLDP